MVWLAAMHRYWHCVIASMGATFIALDAAARSHSRFAL
jgi:hypothetical protein